MQPTSTQGTDRAVKSISVLASGANFLVLAAQAGVVYRPVGCQVSMDAAGSFAVYQGAVYAATKVIAEGFAAANGGSNPPLADWAPQVGAVNEKIQADITGGNARIVVHYIEIKTGNN